MIPLKLQIKNFLSYGPNQTIDFSPYSLICLSGKNGHGKSALLDAITWAIWGQARKISNSSKADEGLLKLGQSQMFVALDFKCNNQIYRIKREYTVLNGKAHANLDFAIAQNTEDQFKPLSDKTIKLTQDKIEQLIGLSYEAFVNSAFLKQAQSNEFSKKSAKERKEILANILGLEKYEKMKKKASEKVKELTVSTLNIKKIQDHLKNELSVKENLQTQLNETLQQYNKSLEQEAKIKAVLEEFHHAKNKLHEQIQTQKINQFKLNDLTVRIEEKKQEFLKQVSNYRSYLKQTRKFKNSNDVIEEKNKLENKLEQFQTIAQTRIILEKDLLELKNREQQKTAKLQSENQTAQTKLKLSIQACEFNINNTHQLLTELINQKSQYEEEIKLHGLEEKNLNHKLNNLKDVNDKFLSTEKILERKKNFYQKFIVIGNTVANNIKECDKKEALIINSTLNSCPLCSQKLEHENKDHFLTQLKKQKTHYEHQFARMSNVVKSLKDNVLEIHKSYESLKKSLNEKNIIEKDLQELNKIIQKKILDNTAIQQKIEQINAVLSGLEKHLNLEKADFLKLENESLNFIDPELLDLKLQIAHKEKAVANLNFDVKEIDILKAKIKELNLLLQNSNVAQTRDFTQKTKEEIHKLCIEIKLQKQEHNKLLLEISQLVSLEDSIKNLENQEKEQVLTLEDCLKNKESLIRTKGALEQQEIILLKFEKEFEKNEHELKLIDNDIEEYQILSTALSKDGIQALLIEDAIPEIEHEANEILSKLTDNQAQIIIESLRDLKSGGTKETLDIKISDPAGIRPYEMFSGGEAFRIDFALRIAISKLLAKRAGTALETLIIDEGFGSQDEEGLSNIMDMIHNIQGNFSKIIIVSHLPMLKEQFPVHFVISKGSTGSLIKVIENG